jgi:putative flippase GtrA
MENFIKSLIDFFYPPFRKLMPLNTFRYGVCGCINVSLDIGLFSFFYNIVYNKHDFLLGTFIFKAHIAAYFTSFLITFPAGFFLSKYIVWSASKVKAGTQLFRYFLIVIMVLVINYVFLKLFIEYLHIYPILSKIMTSAIAIIFGFLSQKYYAFKVKSLNYQ